MAYQPELAGRLSQFGKTFIDYNLNDPEGQRPILRKTLKFGSETPSAEEIQSAVSALVTEAESEYQLSLMQPDPYDLMKMYLDGFVGEGAYDAVRTSLAEIGGKTVDLGQFNLRVSAQTEMPESPEEELQVRIESRLGEGSYESVKQALKSLNIKFVNVERVPTIISL